MMKDRGFPQLRTVLVLGCVVLVCTFYWDIVILKSMQVIRHNFVLHSLMIRRTKFEQTNWTWVCASDEQNQKFCQRVSANKVQSFSSTSLPTCIMTCQPGSQLWPYPTGNVKVKKTYSPFNPDRVKIDHFPVNNAELSLLLKKTTMLYQNRISRIQGSHKNKELNKTLTIFVQVSKTNKDTKYKLNIDESYKLLGASKNGSLQFTIKASTIFGARHGLETFLQLIWWEESRQTLMVMNAVDITDSPIFTYRGLMLDTAQNYLPVASILRTLDGMSMNKMNVFHWHLTGSKSFPFDSGLYPKFALTGSYSDKEVYRSGDIKEVIDYAEVRGIAVLMEVDAPAHTGERWNWGEEDNLGNLSLSSKTLEGFCPEPPCGQLNPVNNNTYLILSKLLKDIYVMTKSLNIIHIGGDDVDTTYWESFPEVTDSDVYMEKGIIGVWEYFYKNLQEYIVREKMSPKTFVFWSNPLLDDTEFWRNTKLIVQSRASSTSGELEKLVKQKMRVIVSSRDVWTVGTPQPWLEAYHHQPWKELTVPERRLVVGGEALAWTDRLDHHSLEPSLWPKVAAVAERLWTDPTSRTSPADRLAQVILRMNREGIHSSPVGPKWCLQNPSQCL